MYVYNKSRILSFRGPSLTARRKNLITSGDTISNQSLFSPLDLKCYTWWKKKCVSLSCHVTFCSSIMYGIFLVYVEVDDFLIQLSFRYKYFTKVYLFILPARNKIKMMIGQSCPSSHEICFVFGSDWWEIFVATLVSTKCVHLSHRLITKIGYFRVWGEWWPTLLEVLVLG